MPMSPPVLPTGSTILVTFRGNCCGQQIRNTFYYRCESNGVLNAMNSVFSALDTAFLAAGQLVPRFLDCVPTNYGMTGRSYQAITPTRYAKFTVEANTNGLCVPNAPTANTAVSITRKTAGATRKDIGRIQLVAAGNDANDDVINFENGIISNVLYAKLELLASKMLSEYTALNYTCYPVMGPGIGIENQPRYIVETTVQETVRTMHRRTVRLGE